MTRAWSRGSPPNSTRRPAPAPASSCPARTAPRSRRSAASGLRQLVDRGHQPALRLRRPALPRSLRLELQRRRGAGGRADHRPRRRRRLPLRGRRGGRRLPLRRRREDVVAPDRRPADALGRRPSAGSGRRALARDRRGQHRRHVLCRLRRLPPGQAGDRALRHHRPRGRQRAGEHHHRQGALRRQRDGLCRDLPRGLEALGREELGELAARALPRTRPGRGRRGAPGPAEPLQRHLQRRRRRSEPGRPDRHRQLRLARWRAVQRLLPLDRRRRELRARQSDRRAEPPGRGPDHLRLLQRRLPALRAGGVDGSLHPLVPDRSQRRVRVAQRPGGRPLEQDRRLGGAGEQQLGPALGDLLSPGHPGLVQPVPRRRSRRPRPRVRGPRGGLRERGRRHPLDRRRPLLELRLLLLVVHRLGEHLPAHHPSRPAFDRDRRRPAVRRRRRRRLHPAASRHGERQRQRDGLAEPQRQRPHAAVLLGGRRQGAGRSGRGGRSPGQRRVAAAAGGPDWRGHDGLAVRRRRRRHPGRSRRRLPDPW